MTIMVQFSFNGLEEGTMEDTSFRILPFKNQILFSGMGFTMIFLLKIRSRGFMESRPMDSIVLAVPCRLVRQAVTSFPRVLLAKNQVGILQYGKRSISIWIKWMQKAKKSLLKWTSMEKNTVQCRISYSIRTTSRDLL